MSSHLFFFQFGLCTLDANLISSYLFTFAPAGCLCCFFLILLFALAEQSIYLQCTLSAYKLQDFNKIVKFISTGLQMEYFIFVYIYVFIYLYELVRIGSYIYIYGKCSA